MGFFSVFFYKKSMKELPKRKSTKLPNFNYQTPKVNETLKRKTTRKFIKRMAVNFLKLRRTFCKKIFCNLTRRSSIILAKKSLGLVLFSRDGWVTADIHIFFDLSIHNQG